MTKYYLIIIHLLLVASVEAQQIKNMSSSLQNKKMVINYELEASEPARIEVYSDIGTDSMSKVPEKHLSGDVGLYVKPGKQKKIRWNMKEIDSLKRIQAEIELRANPFIDMVQVKGGTFKMGCTSEQPKCDKDEKPVHKVTLSDYTIGRYEITNEQYCVFLNEQNISSDGRDGRTSLIHIGNSHCQVRYVNGEFVPKEGKADYPVVEVTWSGAQAFCEWAGGRLPTEAEWEYAARGGHKSKETIYSGANHVDSIAWYVRNSGDHSHPVGTKKPNELGIYDMSGNVWEWCNDWYGDYPSEPQNNPKGPKRGNSVVIRGGSWLYYGSFCRVSNRGSSAPSYAFNNYGFRLVKKKLD
ncbi:MAG: formylglycine-generating enzyme family protein [Bacteroidota bacterium]